MTPPPRRPTRRPSTSISFAFLAVLGLLTVVLGARGGWGWSLIPEHLDARVHTTTWAEEGPPFKVLDLAGGRDLTIDTGLYERMGGQGALVGHTIHKAAGDRTVTVGDRTVSLRPSLDFWKTIFTLSGLVSFAVWRHRRRRRPYRAEPGVTR